MTRKLSQRNFINASVPTGTGVLAGGLSGSKAAVTDASGRTVRIPQGRIPVVAEADVVVIGGGPAGFGPAMRAARSGLKMLLIERLGGPGGAATSGYMCITGEGGTFPLHTEWVNGLKEEGWLLESRDRTQSSQVDWWRTFQIKPGTKPYPPRKPL